MTPGDAVVEGAGDGVEVALVPAVNPRPGSGENSEVSGVPLTVGFGVGEARTTFTGSCAMTTSGPRPFANSAPFAPTATSILDSNLSPG